MKHLQDLRSAVRSIKETKKKKKPLAFPSNVFRLTMMIYMRKKARPILGFYAESERQSERERDGASRGQNVCVTITLPPRLVIRRMCAVNFQNAGPSIWLFKDGNAAGSKTEISNFGARA